jgi:hypothetical protein
VFDRTRIKADLVSRAADVRALLEQTTPQARQMLSTLLGAEKFTVTPVQAGERRSASDSAGGCRSGAY